MTTKSQPIKSQPTKEPEILTAVRTELLRMGETNSMDEQIVHGLLVVLYNHGVMAGRPKEVDEKSTNC